MTDPDLDQIFAALRADEGEHLGSVASRVMGQIDSTRRRAAISMTLAAAAAALVLIASLPFPRRAEILAINITTPAAPEIRYAPQREKIHVAGSSHKRLKSRGLPRLQLAKATPGPLEVRMQTDDPDVLIIWLVDGEEEQQKGHP